MKAPLGKIIVRFFPETDRKILLPAGSDPVPIEAEIIDDSTSTFNQGQRVIVSRMGGTDWGNGTMLATIEPRHVLFIRHAGSVIPAPNLLLVENRKQKSFIVAPEATVNDITKAGVVKKLGDGDWDFQVGDVVHYEPHAATPIRINGTELHLVRAELVYAFEEAA